MKKLLVCCLLIFSASVCAMSELDQRLQGYVEKFNLKAMTPPGPINRKLFFLGREFFFEKKISGNNNISCADCHHPMTMTHDGLPLGLGEGAVGMETVKGGRQQKNGVILARNTPALFNLHQAPVMFWDGRVQLDLATGQFTTPSPLPSAFLPTLKSALAAQALFPMVNHEEMRGQKGTNEIADAGSDQEAWDLIFKRIIGQEKYQKALTELFPGEELNLAHVAEAIAHFQSQAFNAADTNYDRYLRGDLEAMSEIQKIGMDVFFNKGKCGECHRGEHLSDFSFHNVGTPQIGPGKMNGDDFGRFEQDSATTNLYAFRVPGLRNASVTAPYMHNGAFKTLAQVIEHYDDIESSLNEYVLVNNYKNYTQKLMGPLANTNSDKIAHLSAKLSRQLFFEESEEKALAEFIRGALTEKRFLDAEISGDYVTGLRIQLSEDGYKKILDQISSLASVRQTEYFYFDVLTPEGYGLRELEKPIKIFFTRTNGEVALNYRLQKFKTSSAFLGVIAAATFENEERLNLGQTEADLLTDMNKDFFERLYRYNNETGTHEIPALELEVMKNDVLGMNELWHKLNLKNLEFMSDELNTPVEDLFFAPTSTNSKEEHFWIQKLKGYEVSGLLQKSIIRTQTGGLETTWAIELKLGKVTKKELPVVVEEWLKELVHYGLVTEDAQGSSPSPSKLTERILQEIF